MEKLTAPKGRGNPPRTHAGTTPTHLPPTLPDAFPRLSYTPAQTQTAWFEPLRMNLHSRATQELYGTSKPDSFPRERAPPFQGGVRTTAEASQTHKAHNSTLMLHETINSACTWLSLSRPCFLTHPFLPLKANASVPQHHRETSAWLWLTCEEKTYTALLVLPSNPSNLEGIKAEMHGKKPESSDEQLSAKKYLPCGILSSISPKAVKIENHIWTHLRTLIEKHRAVKWSHVPPKQRHHYCSIWLSDDNSILEARIVIAFPWRASALQLHPSQEVRTRHGCGSEKQFCLAVLPYSFF